MQRPTFTPHATLAYLDDAMRRYRGPVPQGSWTVLDVEVWAGGNSSEPLVVKLANQPDALLLEIADSWGVSVDEAVAHAHQSAGFKPSKDVKVYYEELDHADALAFGEFYTLECDVFDEEQYMARMRDLSEEARANRINEAFKKFHETVNMGESELERWSKTEFSKKASVSREPITRNLRLLGKKKEDWTLADASGAMRTVSFVARMRKGEQGKPVKVNGREGPNRRDISLKNWAFDPKK